MFISFFVVDKQIFGQDMLYVNMKNYFVIL